MAAWKHRVGVIMGKLNGSWRHASTSASAIARARQGQAARNKAFAALAVVVALVVAWLLMQPASALSGEPTCGLQEHTHTAACCEQVLTCGLGEGEGAGATEAPAGEGGAAQSHVHDDACYEQRLVCELPEHVHSSACYTDADSGIMPAGGGEETTIPAEVQAALAKDGVYPYHEYTVNADGTTTWTAMDGKADSEARVKVEVTLPSDVTVPDDYYLFVREVESQDEYANYPREETLKEYAGDVTDSQVYSIHWVQINSELDGGYSYKTDSILTGDVTATVKLTYLKKEEGVVLNGHVSERKLRIFNSSNSGQTLTEVGHMTDVTATDDYYTSFTFTTKEAGPYVFVSQKLFKGYVSALSVTNIADGTAPFDSTGSLYNGTIDVPGNDNGGTNGVVRSYDTVLYNKISVTSAMRQEGATATEGKLWLEMSLQADLSEASIAVGEMSWMEDNYVIYYLNDGGEVLYWQDAAAYSAGNYYYMGDSAASPTPTTVSAIEAGATEKKTATLNAILKSSTYNNASYTAGVATQRLIACKELQAGTSDTDNNLLTSTNEYSAAVQVLNAANESNIAPTFRAWWDGNETNYGSESGSGGTVVPAEPVTANQVTAKAVKVSSAASFNLELVNNSNVTHKGWFDRSTGQEITGSSTAEYTIDGQTVTGAQIYALLEALADLDENEGMSDPEKFTDENNACSSYLAEGLSLSDYKTVFSNIRYGRITGYGLTLQVYNDVSGAAGKRFKGTLLPQGDISFDLDLSSIATSDEITPNASSYYSELWDYSENRDLRANRNYTYNDPYIGANGKVNYQSTTSGSLNRNMYWDYLAGTCYAQWAATYNGLYASDATYGNYYGGTWSLSENDEYNFTVSGYDFSFSAAGLTFPTTKAGNGAASTGYNSYIGCFSSGQFQVLNVFPRYQSGTVNMKTTVTAKDLTLTTTDGTRFAPDSTDTTGYDKETSKSDNRVPTDIPLYKRGGLTKANAFCSSAFCDENTSTDIGRYFLGTNFWSVNYDESAFAGQDITLVGAARIGAGDHAIRSMNILQLFDSEALTIDLSDNKEPYVVSTVTGAVQGDTTILYAADPDYPDGYDTNNPDVMKYMSTVREEYLVYYESMDELEKAGYTCIGVMAELRGWTIPGESSYSTVLKIPMTVTDSEEYLGKTVGTVNTVRAWTNEHDMAGVSWKDGTYDPEKQQNSVKDYVTTNNDEHYSPKTENGSAYTKTEYENGQVVMGTNTNGYVYGNTLLILGYKAEVEIRVDRDDNSTVGYPTYNLDDGDSTVTYRLGGVIARVEDGVGNAQGTKTDLTVTTKLDVDNTGDEQRIAVASGTYRMASSSGSKICKTDENGNLAYGDDGKPVYLDPVEISDDSKAPTTVSYVQVDENGNVVMDGDGKPVVYTISIYAALDASGTGVVFHLSDVTVGVSVPEITFDAEINPANVSNGDAITTNVYISGTSDVRAYTEVNGNMDAATIGIIQLGNTRLVKSVDQRYIELNGEFAYTVTYTNGGNDVLDTLYLYDLLANEDDNRGSKYEGNLALTGINAYLSEGSDFSGEVKFYYSMKPYTELREAIDLTDANNRDKTKIEAVLSTHFKELGTILSGDSKVTYSEAFEALTDDDKNEITGIYIVARNLQGSSSINFEIEVKTKGNAAGDLYKNRAYSWLGDESGALMSNLVETTAISRSISGVVWHDKNLDGIRDDEEPLLSGITATLFQWDEKQEKYVVCTNDVTGGNIGTNGTVITDEDGAYSFDKLAEGDYIVAFSGDALKTYTGATDYQADGGSDVSSDGKSLSDLNEEISGIDTEEYAYFIHYSKDGRNIKLHSLTDIAAGITLNGGVEDVAHQDLGVVITGPELPMTGGSGTIPYIVAGLVLVISTGTVLMMQHKKRRRADS